jgi:hypothetical protein
MKKILCIALLASLVTAFPFQSSQAAQCVTALHDGARSAYSTHIRSSFVFDSGWAFESYDFIGEDGGGQGLYRQRGSQWCLVTHDGGALGEGGLIHAGVPRTVAHRLVQKMNAKLK